MNLLDPRRALAVARKEIRHILRDPFTLALALGLPLILVTFFGFAIDFEVRDIRLAVHDRDHTRQSRQLAEVFSSSGYFRLIQPGDPGRSLRQLDSQQASAVLVVEPRFGRNAESGRPARAQFVLDGADNARASAILGYLPGLSAAAGRRILDSPPPEAPALRTRFLYNHELNSRWFVIPGLIVIVVGLLAILLTALTVAREWENGSMELLLSTPVQPLEIITGKLLPYAGLCLIDGLFVYLAARIGFGVPFLGSHLLFLSASALFVLACLSWGLLISVATRQQQLAMQFALISGLLPSLMLSGFVFPIESMPAFFQYFTAILPQRWFMAIARGVFLKGADAWELAQPICALLAIDCALMIAAAKRFKMDLEP
jgi:ABC-2 type transport system permease protein